MEGTVWLPVETAPTEDIQATAWYYFATNWQFNYFSATASDSVNHSNNLRNPLQLSTNPTNKEPPDEPART
ncbi:hypothetical protein GPY53_12005 [Photorhabdus laumondii subsp. laumondii]|nr:MULTISPECIES: hypothetical protein [Photorhabdus]MCC8385645.1 hypothetical protein [Photorhabdus laumondii]NDL16772.1 hypothetical protein [Photorhabdus laumondii subsp. laumondii]NDL21318.1 hypothetical protein [Photorhabdus laumondii subsp. laumondii]NDL30287.1 hypothetical protein [Photorhabdus laumondii subsp. laumondii]NDL52971.1 hypothetical protein [Photorhabdus laumondii subsp. laumondii]